MKVRDFIALLQRQNPDAELGGYDPEWNEEYLASAEVHAGSVERDGSAVEAVIVYLRGE